MKKIILPESRAKTVRTNGHPTDFAPRNILVPVDFSELSETALQRAVVIALQFGGQLILVNAVEPIHQPVEFAVFPAELQDINMRQLESHKERLELMRQRVGRQGLRCKVQVKVGRPWQVIVAAARKCKAELIILPTHGRTGPAHLFLGSTAERVVQHAPCSVLVIR